MKCSTKKLRQSGGGGEGGAGEAAGAQGRAAARSDGTGALGKAATRLEMAAAQAAQVLADSKTQARLDTNLNALRARLLAHGTPRRDGDRLYFGEHLVNGDAEIVDEQ